MPLNNRESDNKIIQSPLLQSLRDDLNLCINDAPMRELAVRQRKNSLIQKDYKEVIAAVNEINTSESTYIKKTLLPMLQDSLQQTTIDSILRIVQNAYASKLGKDSFTEKKWAIKDKLHSLYEKKMFDNKLIFGLGMTLYKNPIHQYNAGTFRADIKKRMYTWDSIHESFWNKVIDTAPQKEAVVDNTTQWVRRTLDQIKTSI